MEGTKLPSTYLLTYLLLLELSACVHSPALLLLVDGRKLVKR